MNKEGIIPQLRQNIVTGEWVVVAPERSKRPIDFLDRKKMTRPDDEDDVFRIGGEEWERRIKELDTDLLYVITNKYPAFIENPLHSSPRSHRVEDDFYRVRPAVGGHDVVVIKNPESRPTNFDVDTWYDLLNTFKKRYLHYESLSKGIYTMPIFNHRPEAAASIWHPHAQIIASTIVPNSVMQEMNHSEKYFEHNGSSVFSDMLEHEKREKMRVVAENRDFLAFTFFAARFPFETWILPKRHHDKFEEIGAGEMKSFAKICRDVFHKLNDALEDPPLNFFIHSAPNTVDNTAYYCWHMEIAPRLANYGGFEVGGDMVIDAVSPENAARFLRGEDYD